MDLFIKLLVNWEVYIGKTKKTTLYAKFCDKSALCAQRFSLKILLQVNLRLRVCLAMCLKYGRFQLKRAYKAPAYKKKVYLGDIADNRDIWLLRWLYMFHWESRTFKKVSSSRNGTRAQNLHSDLDRSNQKATAAPIDSPPSISPNRFPIKWSFRKFQPEMVKSCAQGLTHKRRNFNFDISRII